jgi:hypothetical protein
LRSSIKVSTGLSNDKLLTELLAELSKHEADKMSAYDQVSGIRQR